MISPCSLVSGCSNAFPFIIYEGISANTLERQATISPFLEQNLCHFILEMYALCMGLHKCFYGVS